MILILGYDFQIQQLKRVKFEYQVHDEYSLSVIFIIIVHAYDVHMWTHVPWPHVEVREGLYGFGSPLGLYMALEIQNRFSGLHA